MKISCNILKKHIKNSENIDFLKIWDTFTVSTAEVEGVEVKGNTFDKIITAKIIACEDHPNSKKLHVLKVDTGKKTFQVVCAAPNCRVGLIGAYAQIGSRIEDITIGTRPLGGIDSEGMMCGADEIGIDNAHETIIEFPDDTPLGQDIKTLFPFEDIVATIDNKSLTNRPDLWGHYGIAREVAAITNHELIPLDLTEIKSTGPDLNINILNPEICYRYMGTKIDKIENNISPIWMRIFLYYTGMRSIDLIVDLTNYVMLELGQPMHAFDARKVKDIEIGLAKKGDKFQTLDEVPRELLDETLMIKNGGEYFAIAGVMGGLDSGILADTNSIVLESACFEASSVRKTSIALGLRTEASSRYEKSLDPNMAESATLRFIKLLNDANPNLELGSRITDVYPTRQETIDVILAKEQLYKYLGFIINDDEVNKILTSLGFIVKINKKEIAVTVPTFRATKDVSLPEDIIEEIARIYGYDNLPVEPLNLSWAPNEYETIIDGEYNIKRFLATKYDLNEVHTNIWLRTSFLKTLNLNFDNVQLLVRKEDNIMRDDMALSLLEMAEINLKNYAEFGIFEIGTTIVNNQNERHLIVLLTNNSNELKAGYHQIKAIAYNVIKVFKNTKPIFDFGEAPDYYHGELTQNIIVNHETVGQIKVFNRSISNKINKKKNFIVLDINFEQFSNLNRNLSLYEEVSKYPTTTLDYTLLIKRGIYYGEIDNILNEFTSPIIKDRELIDIYLDEETKKVTIRYTVGSVDKTLTSEELENFKNAFIKFLHTKDISIIEG